MRRLTALGAVWLLFAALGGAALAQGLPDVRLGNEAFRQGDYAAAVGHYTDAIRSGELVGEALAITYNNRGVAHGEAGDFDPAIADYSQALALRPDDETTIRNLRVAHVRRGEVRFASGAYDSAIADFTRAVELEPDHHLAYQRRGELYVELGLLDLAVDDLERAALINPGDPEIMAALERAATQRESVIATVEGGAAPVEEPTPMAGAATPESPPAALEPPPVAEAPADEAPSSPPSIVVEEQVEAEDPTVADRPEQAPRAAEVEPERSAPAPAPAEAPPVAEAAPEPRDEPSSPASTTAVPGEPYRVVSAVNFRAGPDNSAARLGTVDAGRIVRVTGDTLGWKHVTLPSGETGYIYRTWLEPVAD